MGFGGTSMGSKHRIVSHPGGWRNADWFIKDLSWMILYYKRFHRYLWKYYFLLKIALGSTLIMRSFVFESHPRGWRAVHWFQMVGSWFNLCLKILHIDLYKYFHGLNIGFHSPGSHLMREWVSQSVSEWENGNSEADRRISLKKPVRVLQKSVFCNSMQLLAKDFWSQNTVKTSWAELCKA